jgi:glutaredoxin
VKELLSRAGVPFEVRNVEDDLAAYRDLLDRGFRTVPVTLIGDEPSPAAVVGFNEAALKSALGLG